MTNDIVVPTVFGLILLIGTLALSYYLPNLPPAGQLVLRVLTAAGAGFLVFGLSGIITIGGERLGFTIKATGGFAVFVIVYFFDPPSRLARLKHGSQP